MLWGSQKPSPAWRGWTGRSPGRVWSGQLKVEAWLNWVVKSPNSRRGRCPHRPETWRAEPAGINLPPCCRTLGPMKGIGPYASGKIVPCNQVRTNISGLPSTPGPAGPPSPSRRGQGFPSSVRAYALPPSPEGKAASGGGITVYLLCCLSGISPGDSSTGCYTAVERSCEEGDIHKNTPQLFYKLWKNFLGFPGGSGGRAGERDGQFASFGFFSSYIQFYPQSFPGFPQNLSTAVDTAVDKFKSLFGITCSGRHRWLRHPSYRHPWPG